MKTESAARKREAKIKKWSKVEKEEFIINRDKKQTE